MQPTFLIKKFDPELVLHSKKIFAHQEQGQSLPLQSLHTPPHQHTNQPCASGKFQNSKNHHTHPPKKRKRKVWSFAPIWWSPLLVTLCLCLSHTHAHAHSERQTKCNTLNAQSFHPKETKRNQKRNQILSWKEKRNLPFLVDASSPPHKMHISMTACCCCLEDKFKQPLQILFTN